MIKDSIDNAINYNNLEKGIVFGLDWIKKTDFSGLKDGKHVLADNIYANIQTYTTKSDALYEAHRDYIDIQYIISGSEKIGTVSYQNCLSEIAYDHNKDIEFLKISSGSESYTELYSGEFMILYPADAHKPSITIDDTPTVVRKVVVKVHI